MSPPPSLFEFLRQLEAAKIHFRLSRIRDNTIVVEIAVPGERWEVEFLEDGLIEVEVFRTAGGVQGPELLDELFANHAD